MAQITPSQAISRLACWQDVNQQEAAELRNTPLDVKFQQLCALSASGAAFPADPDRDAHAAALIARWCRIRAYYGVWPRC